MLSGTSGKRVKTKRNSYSHTEHNVDTVSSSEGDHDALQCCVTTAIVLFKNVFCNGTANDGCAMAHSGVSKVVADFLISRRD